MFFIMGVNNGEKLLPFGGTVRCPVCGNYTNPQLYVTYSVLSVFFIPVLKWGKKYYLRTNCCGSVFLLDDRAGKAIARGENINITPDDLTLIQSQNQRRQRYCPHCGAALDSDFSYCPHCGNKLNSR